MERQREVLWKMNNVVHEPNGTLEYGVRKSDGDGTVRLLPKHEQCMSTVLGIVLSLPGPCCHVWLALLQPVGLLTLDGRAHLRPLALQSVGVHGLECMGMTLMPSGQCRAADPCQLPG